jgi:adenylate kinase family enzyme
MKKILIIGDAGRGKTTFAEKLSQKLNIPVYSTDDFYWEVKFTKPRGKELDMEKAREVFVKDEWIVEGGTRRMLKLGLEDADQIFYLVHNSLWEQMKILYKRNRVRKNENLKNVLYLMYYQFMKKHKLGKHKNLESFDDMLKPFKDKVIELDSFEKINEYLESSTI